MQIRVIPETVRNGAQQLRSVAQALNDEGSALTTIRTQLDSAWDGGASIQALDVLSEVKAATSELSENLAGIATAVDSYIQAIESIDMSGTVLIRTDIRLVDLVTTVVFCPPDRFVFPSIVSGDNITVRVIPDELRQVATLCVQHAEEFENAGTKVASVLTQLQNDWEGNAATKFQEKLQPFATNCNGIRDSLNTFAERLNQAANRYEEIDNLF